MSLQKQKILMTGHDGYIGSVMGPLFQASGYDVVGLDSGYFSQCKFTASRWRGACVTKDIRDLLPEDLRGFDAVIHLAALSNDPIGNLNDAWTEDINYHASIRLAELAKAAGVRRFLFSSSCIMYGMSSDRVVDETAPLDPQTEYARSKARAEQALAALADDGFSPIFLRNGTVYGVSPGMRFDTVLNNLAGQAITSGSVTIYSDGKPWRPVVHVEDVSRAFLEVMRGPDGLIHNQAFNTGSDDLNCRILQLAEYVTAAVPGCRLHVLADASADQRTYKTDFAKFREAFPRFKFKWRPEEGARQLCSEFEAIRLNSEHFSDKRFTRLKWLRHLLSNGQLDERLRWTEKPTSQ